MISAASARPPRPSRRAVDEEKGVSIARAFALLRESKQIQLIAAVISFGRSARC